ncbi:MAG TPA: response regulator, partial [Terriglobia bacterium]
GCAFHFTADLGLAADDGRALESEAVVTPVEPSRAPLRILLAEDNLVNQKLACRLLEKHGHRMAVAGNGLEALAMLERETFDLALLDVQMPELDGLETARAIRDRERRTGIRLPIVALTAHAMPGDRERCLEAGMDAYVSKPIQKAQLFAAIAQAFATVGPSNR